MIKSQKLSCFSKIKHGFFNKKGGVSRGIYKSLNCGIGSNDNKKNIKKNIKIVKSIISKKSQNIVLVNQTHSSKYIFINKYSKIYKKKFKADAIITSQKKLPIAVLTADCVPLLLYDKKNKIIAAVHAGWKGALKGIIQRVINFMKKKGCKGKNIIAAIGPSIMQKSYVVKEDFKKKFLKKNKKNKIFFKKFKKEIYFDLPSYVKYQLRSNRISNIDMMKIDTFNQKNNFFSARYALKAKHADYGRNISIIMIK